MSKEDGWFLTGIDDFREHKSYQLTLERQGLSKLDAQVASTLCSKQTDNGIIDSSIPRRPRLEVSSNGGEAYLFPHFSKTDPDQTIGELQNTQTVIQRLNEAIAK